MKLLGLDVGDRRIGVACGDTDVRIATPIDVVVRTQFDADVRAMTVFVHKYEVAKLIVGLPRNMDGTTGDQARSVIDYAEKLASVLNLPMQLWDERLSTVEATRRRNETGARGKKSRLAIDAVAAAVILQDYLDSQSNQNSMLADSAENI
jgi:putative Holliday junction resolvase